MIQINSIKKTTALVYYLKLNEFLLLKLFLVSMKYII